ncbi:nucleolus protein [Seminavis robusta]|uniref:Nucleolus protein n=1 Tax=Seminavis robusta TaxID=568900 RepID=A0A9N8EIZ4_9STRA|nr:nucleolus protein [Seminavis robusta]|eukprot:Sro1156_g247230.1 nucleolus protein (314) ;mRNA; f:2840-3781
MAPKNKRKTVPLAPPPHASTMKSRKRARQVTTLFHKYTRERDLALQKGDPTKEWDEKLEDIGGREEYQKASQLSTTFHSTSKWVLGYLQRNGWLYGIRMDEGDDNPQTKKKRKRRRDTKLLEIGAINTELLDAAERTMDDKTTKKYRLNVRAIDLHSMHPGRIEEADFLKLPLNTHTGKSCDVIVCSMVLNCVTTPEDRGEMLTRIHHLLRPGGILFLTIPRLCLSQSPYVTREQFLSLLGESGVGLVVKETKESPKVAFFLCKRPDTTAEPRDPSSFDEQWTQLRKVQRGKKYRNQFAVVLDKHRVLQTGSC